MRILLLILHACITHGMFETSECKNSQCVDYSTLYSKLLEIADSENYKPALKESMNDEITSSPVIISKNKLKTLNRLDEREMNYSSFKSKLQKLPVNRYNKREMNYSPSKSKLEKSPEMVFKSFPTCNESSAEKERTDSAGSVESEKISDENLNPETYHFDDKTQYFSVYHDKDLQQTSKCKTCCKNKIKEAILSEILVENVKWVRFLENSAIVLSAEIIHKTDGGTVGDYSFDGFFIENNQIIHKRLLRRQDGDYYQNLLSKVEITKNKLSRFQTEDELKEYFEHGANFGTTYKIGEYKIHI